MSALGAAPAPDRPLRLGFVGLGWIGRNRMQALIDEGLAVPAVVLDSAPAATDALHDLAPEAAIANSIEDLLTDDLDGVVIATPNALHAEQAVAALQRGLPVFCQKPLGRSAPEVRQVLKAARDADRLLGVDLSYRHAAGMRRIRELVQGGALGNVFAAELTFHNAYGPDKAWFYDRALSGGGALMDLGIHLIDLALWVLGADRAAISAAHLRQAGARLASRDCIEDYADATLEVGGAVTRIVCSWRLNAGRDALISARFYGTEAGAAFRNVGGSFCDFEADLFRGTASKRLASPPDAWGGRAIASWARRVARGEGFSAADAADLVAGAETLDAIYARALRD